MYCVVDTYTGEILIDSCVSRNEAQDKASDINSKIIKERIAGVGLARAVNYNTGYDFEPMTRPVFDK